MANTARMPRILALIFICPNIGSPYRKGADALFGFAAFLKLMAFGPRILVKEARLIDACLLYLQRFHARGACIGAYISDGALGLRHIGHNFGIGAENLGH